MSKNKLFIVLFVVMGLVFSSFSYASEKVAAEGVADAGEYTDDTDDEDWDEDDEDDEDEDWDEDDEDWDLLFEPVINFQASKIGKTSVILKWDSRDDVDGYLIEYKKAGTSKWKPIYVKGDSSKKCVVKKLKADTKYTFRIMTYIYYGEDEAYYDDEDYDDEDYDEDVEDDTDYDAEDEYDDTDDEVIPDFEYGKYSVMTLRTLNKSGQGAKTAVSNTFEHKADKSYKAPKIKSAKTGRKKSAVVKWKKSGNVVGYEVFVSKKKGKGYRRVKKIKGVNKTSCVVKKLRPGKTYYFKLRAYVKMGGLTAYTGYSKVKKVKMK